MQIKQKLYNSQLDELYKLLFSCTRCSFFKLLTALMVFGTKVI